MLSVQLGRAWVPIFAAVAVLVVYLLVPRLVGAWRDWGILWRKVHDRDPWVFNGRAGSGPPMVCGDCRTPIRGDIYARHRPGKISGALRICRECYVGRKVHGRHAA